MLTSAQESKEMAFFRGAFVHSNGYRLQKYVKKKNKRQKQTNKRTFKYSIHPGDRGEKEIH